MSLERSVLLVSPTGLGNAVAPIVRRVGCRLTLARTFQTAKSQLTNAPDLLITELKLAAYNGLQLALRSLAAGIPTIVISDRSFEHDVEQLGAIWMSPEDAASDELQNVITRLLHESGAQNAAYSWMDADSTEPLPILDADQRAPAVH